LHLHSQRTGVAVIFSFYFLTGFLSSIASFVSITYSSDTVGEILLSISGVIYFLLFVSGALGMTLMRKDNAVMMRKLSIASWVITVLILIYNLTVYILEIITKSDSVKQCQDDVSQDADVGLNDNIDCNKVVNIFLVKDALKLIFVEFFSLYFSYVIYRFSRRMLEDSRKNPILPYSINQDGLTTPSYVVYDTRPPTSLDWVPPPTYTVRANDVSSDTRSTPAS